MNGTKNVNGVKKKWYEVAFEDIVVTLSVAIGILGGGIMSLFPQFFKPIIISIFLGIGISSLVYRFLGGITQDNSFAVKGIKLTGTVAVLIATIWIINNELAKQIDKTAEEIMRKELILTVLRNDRLMRGIQLTVAQDIIPPQQVDQSKFTVTQKKFCGADKTIIIDRISDTSDPQQLMKMKYDPIIPEIIIDIDK